MDADSVTMILKNLSARGAAIGLCGELMKPSGSMLGRSYLASAQRVIVESWRDNPLRIAGKYAEWAKAYQENQVTVVYGTVRNGAAKIAHDIARKIPIRYPDTAVKVYNILKSDKNKVPSEIFKSKAIALGFPTLRNSVLSGAPGFLDFQRKERQKREEAGSVYSHLFRRFPCKF